jgi:hypothetical protein
LHVGQRSVPGLSQPTVAHSGGAPRGLGGP